MKESVIQKGILDYLETVPNIYDFRAGSGSFRLASGRYMRTGRPGVPDIVCCIKGIFTGIEVKNEKGRQSAVQKQAQKEIEEAGGRYYIVRSIAEVKEIIND